MSELESLVQRIRNEFESSREKLIQYEHEQIERNQARQERLKKLEEILHQLRGIWRPRFEAFAKEFGDRVEIKPTVTPGHRQATMHFKTPLAAIKLRISASADADIQNLVLAYDLEILPILMEFQRHAEISFPIDKVDPQAIGKWLDDQMVQFVKTYLQVHENPHYLKGHMVDDPVAKIRFPQFAAVTTRERDGKVYYFISEETAAEFDSRP